MSVHPMEDHMRADVTWFSDPAFDAEFDRLIVLQEEKRKRLDMATSFTKSPDVQPSFPGYISISFEGGGVVLTVRGDPRTVPADKDNTEYVRPAATVTLSLAQGDWDQLIAAAIRERGLVPGG